MGGLHEVFRNTSRVSKPLPQGISEENEEVLPFFQGACQSKGRNWQFVAFELANCFSLNLC